MHSWPRVQYNKIYLHHQVSVTTEDNAQYSRYYNKQTKLFNFFVPISLNRRQLLQLQSTLRSNQYNRSMQRRDTGCPPTWHRYHGNAPQLSAKWWKRKLFRKTCRRRRRRCSRGRMSRVRTWPHGSQRLSAIVTHKHCEYWRFFVLRWFNWARAG